MTKPTNQSLHEIDKKHYLPTFNRLPIAFEKGKGTRLWDIEGNEYIDMLAGIAVNSVGHCHPKVVAAIQKQAAELIHISNFFVSPAQVALSQKLTSLSGLDHVFLSNSGAESTEGAIKIARKYASKHGRGGTIISMHNAFHGRTLATIATGQEKYQKGFGPMPAGFDSTPFNDFEAIREKVINNNEVAAIIVEPVQGEGGINLADQEYLIALRHLCDEQNIVLIFDEIQCGVGRTGKWFAKDHYGVQPDIMALAKGLGGGIPIGAFLCTSKIGAAVDYGDHGTTFGGNPLASAASLATLETIETENLCDAALKNGQWFMNRLESLQKEFPVITEVRGLGLMIGVEMAKPAAPLLKLLLQKNVIANVTAENVLRFVPALNIERKELEEVLNRLTTCLNEF